MPCSNYIEHPAAEPDGPKMVVTARHAGEAQHRASKKEEAKPYVFVWFCMVSIGKQLFLYGCVWFRIRNPVLFTWFCMVAIGKPMFFHGAVCFFHKNTYVLFLFNGFVWLIQENLCFYMVLSNPLSLSITPLYPKP